MEIKLDIEPQKIADLMVNAIELGIGYWAEDVRVITPYGYGKYDKATTYEGNWKVTGKYPLTDDGSEMGEFEFDNTQFAARIQLAPRHLADWLAEGDDAETADALFQTAAFGEIVYG